MPKEAAFTPPVPIETFEFMVTHECYRSIYNPWRRVLEYLACEDSDLLVLRKESDLAGAL
jgi:type I site-specific restriction endonuclease